MNAVDDEIVAEGFGGRVIDVEVLIAIPRSAAGPAIAIGEQEVAAAGNVVEGGISHFVGRGSGTWKKRGGEGRGLLGEGDGAQRRPGDRGIGDRVIQRDVVHVPRHVQEPAAVDRDRDDVVVIGDFTGQNGDAGAVGLPGRCADRAAADDDVVARIVIRRELKITDRGEIIQRDRARIDVARPIGVGGKGGERHVLRASPAA